MFFLTYGGLMSLGVPADAGPETAPIPTEPRELPAVRKVLEAIDRGGFLEAIARVGALMASQRGEFPLSRLELAGELRQSDPVLSKLTEEEARRIRSEQSTLVHLEPEKAMEALPKLLTDVQDREHLLDLVETSGRDGRAECRSDGHARPDPPGPGAVGDHETRKWPSSVKSAGSSSSS